MRKKVLPQKTAAKKVGRKQQLVKKTVDKDSMGDKLNEKLRNYQDFLRVLLNPEDDNLELSE